MSSNRYQRRCGRPAWRLVAAAAVGTGIGSAGLVLADNDVPAVPVPSANVWANAAVSEGATHAGPGRLSGLGAALVEHPRPDVRSIRPSAFTGSSDAASSGAGKLKGMPWPPDPPALTSRPAASPPVVAPPPVVRTSTEPPIAATPAERVRSDPPVGAAAPSEVRTAVVQPAISHSARRLAPSPPEPGGGTSPGVAMPHPRVFLHFSTITTDGADDARRVSAYLRARGFEVVDIRAVPFPIGTAKVRYFFADDAAAARRVTGTFAEFQLGRTARQGPVRMQDYAHFRPLPTRGNVEVWLPSGSARRAS